MIPKQEQCPVCLKQGVQLGTFTIDGWAEYPGGFRCCELCGSGGIDARAKRWALAFLKRWRESGIAIEGSGDFMRDKEQVDNFLKHTSRIDDGVCPNGCAFLVRIDGEATGTRCPSCGFEHYTTVL